MRKLIVKIMVLVSLLCFPGCNVSEDPASWNTGKIDKWFEKGEWLNGWEVSPDASINRRAFAISYFKNKERWDKAFVFLKESEFSTLELMRYDIDGDNLFATVSEYLTKDEVEARFEAHQRYIDIQYVITGIEQIGLSPMSNKIEVIEPYDAAKDIEFLTVTQEKNIEATQKRFFIFFPSDAHRPGLKVGDKAQVKKIVVKVRVE